MSLSRRVVAHGSFFFLSERCWKLEKVSGERIKEPFLLKLAAFSPTLLKGRNMISLSRCGAQHSVPSLGCLSIFVFFFFV